MKGNYPAAVLTVAVALTTSGCRDNIENKIVGKYEHRALPGQYFEFHADHAFVNTAEAGTMDCIIRHPGTWKVDGDSLFIFNDNHDTTYEFGDTVSEERKALVRGLFERMSENRPEQSAFKIIGVDEKMLSLERDGQITTYERTDSLTR